MVIASISKLEKWRRARGFTQRALAAQVYASDLVISRAERGLPIRLKYIDRLVELAEGCLARSDFKQAAQPKGNENGSTSKSKGRPRKGRRSKRGVRV